MHANISSSGNKTKELSFSKRKEPTLAQQHEKSGKLNSCQADGWHYHSTFSLTILLEKVIKSSIPLLCLSFLLSTLIISILRVVRSAFWTTSSGLTGKRAFIFKGLWPLTGLLSWTAHVLNLLHRFKSE